MSKDDPYMRGVRSRNETTGRLRDKRDDTKIETIERKYHLDLGVRSDMHLGTYLKKVRLPSLHVLVESGIGRENG